ncbi:MAG: hypothetical protein NT038_02505 [Euryarchaeota archaeon]|nr:hypothetical protein [Euryarchaeota archaeon]
MNKELQYEQQNPVRRLRNYGAGALVVIFISLGIATIVYNNNILPFYPIHLITWIIGPLGVYTSIYAFFGGRDRFHYLVYGVIMIIGGLMAVTYTFIVPMTLIGVLLIVLAVIGLVAYWRQK